MKTFGKIIGIIVNSIAAIFALLFFAGILFCVELVLFSELVARHLDKLVRKFPKSRAVIAPRAKLTPQK